MSENCKRNMLTSQLENSEPPEIKIGANEHPIAKNVPFLFCFPPSSKRERVVIKEIGGVCHLSFQRKNSAQFFKEIQFIFFNFPLPPSVTCEIQRCGISNMTDDWITNKLGTSKRFIFEK